MIVEIFGHNVGNYGEFSLSMLRSADKTHKNEMWEVPCKLNNGTVLKVLKCAALLGSNLSGKSFFLNYIIGILRNRLEHPKLSLKRIHAISELVADNNDFSLGMTVCVNGEVYTYEITYEGETLKLLDVKAKNYSFNSKVKKELPISDIHLLSKVFCGTKEQHRKTYLNWINGFLSTPEGQLIGSELNIKEVGTGKIADKGDLYFVNNYDEWVYPPSYAIRLFVGSYMRKVYTALNFNESVVIADDFCNSMHTGFLRSCLQMLKTSKSQLIFSTTDPCVMSYLDVDQIYLADWFQVHDERPHREYMITALAEYSKCDECTQGQLLLGYLQGKYKAIPCV